MTSLGKWDPYFFYQAYQSFLTLLMSFSECIPMRVLGIPPHSGLWLVLGDAPRRCESIGQKYCRSLIGDMFHKVNLRSLYSLP